MENRTLGKVLMMVIVLSFIITPVYAIDNLQTVKYLSIMKIDNININIYQNQNYKLPKEVKAVYSDKKVRTVNVTWDVKTIDTSTLETNSYYGKISGYNSLVKLTVRIMAPDFELKDTDGKLIKLSDFRGKTVIINFWTTWCKYCHDIMPSLNELFAKYSGENEVEIISINEMEDYNKVKEYISQNAIFYPILLDKDGEVANCFGGISGYPNTIIINKDGTYNKTIIGTTSKEDLETVINKIK